MLTPRTVIASIFISVANLYTCALPTLLIVKGVMQQPELPLAVYLGVLIAVALYALGYASAARPREALPGAITVIVVGAIAQPITSGLSAALGHDSWFLAFLLIAVPIGLVVAGLRIGRRVFASGAFEDGT
jgi:hypothetical protein